MIPGIYPNLSNEEYHGHTGSISRSAIMDFIESPKKYWANYINPNRPKKEQTPDMVFGEAFHTLILEPYEFHNRFAVEPQLEKLPKVGLLRDLGREEYDLQKKMRAASQVLNDSWIEQFEATSKGKKILTQADMNILLEMQDSLMNNKRAEELIIGALYEQSYFWEDSHSGLLVKCRPDILHDNLIVDLKTCKSASPKAFQYAMADGGYHLQGAMICAGRNELEGLHCGNVINIAIEKKYPYLLGIYLIDEIALDAGHQKFKETLVDIKSANAHNDYPDYGVQTIGLPKWAI